jgi:hypothetical protein
LLPPQQQRPVVVLEIPTTLHHISDDALSLRPQQDFPCLEFWKEKSTYNDIFFPHSLNGKFS